MKEQLKFSAMSVAYVQYSLDYVIASYQKLGLKAIEFWAAEPHFHAQNFPDRQRALDYLRSIKEKLDDAGIVVSMYTAETLNYPASYSHPEKHVRDATLAYMKAACEEALVLGCKRVFVNTGCGLRDLPREDSWRRCVQSYQDLCDYAAGLGVEIVMEQLQPYESNLVTNLDDCRRMKSDVSRDNFKICLDVVAMEVAGEKMEDYFEAFGKDLVHIHLADQNHEILGKGSYQIDEYLTTLKERDFQDYVSLEINDSIYWMDPHKSLELSINWLRDKGYIG